MKRLSSLVAVLLFLAAAVPLFAVERDRRTLIDDVIRMSQAGVSDDSIITFVQKTQDRVGVNADDLIAMADAHVSRAVIKAVVDEADYRSGRRDSRYSYSAPRAYLSPYPYYYDPYYAYDPFWYGPRVGLSFRFGGGYGRGYYGGHRGGHHRHR